MLLTLSQIVSWGDDFIEETTLRGFCSFSQWVFWFLGKHDVDLNAKRWLKSQGGTCLSMCHEHNQKIKRHK